MSQNRRMFLKALGVGVAFVSLPEISPVFNIFTSRPAPNDDLAATLNRLFGRRATGSGPFLTHASSIITETSPQQLFGSPSALLGIMERLGVERTFSDSVGYGEASQCRPHFESQEQDLRNRFGAGVIFTNVRRSPSERDVAVMVGGKVSPAGNTLERAEGGIQYQHKPAVRLVGRDPGVLLAASTAASNHVRLSASNFARSYALVEPPKPVEMDDGQRARRYETPVHSVVYIPRARRNNSVGSRAVGVIAVNYKSTPENIYFADLYV